MLEHRLHPGASSHSRSPAVTVGREGRSHAPVTLPSSHDRGSSARARVRLFKDEKNVNKTLEIQRWKRHTAKRSNLKEDNLGSARNVNITKYIYNKQTFTYRICPSTTCTGDSWSSCAPNYVTYIYSG